MGIKKRKAKSKRTTTSKKKKPARHSDYISGKILPKEKEDPEEEGWDDDEGDAAFLDDVKEEFKDFEEGEHPKAMHPPPKSNRTFVKKWRSLIDTIAGRDNFKDAHLHQLEILCDLFVEYEDLSTFLRKNGYTYEAFGRQGKAIKPFPEVLQLNRVKTEIRNYSKMLGLIISKDKDTGGGASKDGEWE